MCRRIRLLARSIHVHIRRWHIRTVSSLSIIRWGSWRRGRVWGRHKHWAGIVCQYGRRGVILTMRQWYWRWIVPHVPVHVRTAAWQLVWRRTWFFWFVDFWWRRNWPWWRFFFEFSFVFRCFVQLATLGSSVFKPHLKQDIYNARISVNKCSIVSLKDSSVYLLCKTISKIKEKEGNMNKRRVPFFGVLYRTLWFCHLFNFLILKALRVISIKFLLVVSLLYKTQWSWELRTWSRKMNLIDTSTNSFHNFYWKRIGTTNENLNFDNG